MDDRELSASNIYESVERRVASNEDISYVEYRNNAYCSPIGATTSYSADLSFKQDDSHHKKKQTRRANIISYLSLVIAIIAIAISTFSLLSKLTSNNQSDNLTQESANVKLSSEGKIEGNNINSNYIQVTKQQGCPTITFHLPRDNQTEDYVRYRAFVPRMEEATVCAWVETTDFAGTFTSIVSYSTHYVNPNAYTLVISSPTSLTIHSNSNVRQDFIVPDMRNFTKMHICQWFSTTRNIVGIYLNGKSIFNASFEGTVIPGGGDMILGQEQDDTDAGLLDRKQALQGNITNFMIWPRVLAEEEIYRIVYNCECPRDFSVVMATDRVELFGEAYYSIPDVCPTL